MALVPFKNLLRLLQKKCGKHLKIDKKDLSRVAKFVSHNGTNTVLKDVEIRKIAYKALCCDRLKVTSQLVSFQSQNLSLV